MHRRYYATPADRGRPGGAWSRRSARERSPRRPKSSDHGQIEQGTELALGSTLIGAELKAEKPAWETIQPQTKEYAQLAADMAKHDPAKGSKESWSKLAAEYAGLATELDKAAQAKDKAAATAAQEDLASSCMACHRQHRGGPGGGMGPGMGRRGGGPPGRRGGPPPGGPDGPPSDAPGAPPPEQK